MTLETGFSIPAESLGGIALLTPEEATLLYGTDGAGGAVLLFTRTFGQDEQDPPRGGLRRILVGIGAVGTLVLLGFVIG